MPSFGAEPQGDFRLFVKKDKLSFYGEFVSRNETDTVFYNSFMLGAYYRVISNLRLGLFYQRQYGVRHDLDWQWHPPNWSWASVNGRGEDVIVVDATPRLLLDTLGLNNWVAEVKLRYFYNFFNDQQTLTARPGLTYFWTKDNDPFVQIFIQYELYFPLNYGVIPVYQTWAYLGFLYNWTRNFQLGLTTSLHSVTWGNTAEYTTRTGGGTFSVQKTSLVTGLVAIVSF
jgi:hypothetical protein